MIEQVPSPLGSPWIINRWKVHGGEPGDGGWSIITVLLVGVCSCSVGVLYGIQS